MGSARFLSSKYAVKSASLVPYICQSAYLYCCCNKRQEWEEYRSEVTAFELRKNLPAL